MTRVSAEQADAALTAGAEQAPIIGFEAADEALDRWKERRADLSGAMGVWLRELSARGATPREPTRREQITALSYDELLADRPLLDRLVRAVGLSRDLDYIEALEEIQSWNDGSNPTVGRLLQRGQVDGDVLCRDLIAMEDRETVHSETEVALLDSSDPKRQVSIEAADEMGRIYLADGVDRAHLLTDAYTIEYAWLKAKELDGRGAYAGEGDRLGDGLTGRERFERDYRAHIEEGVDLVASLEAEHRRATADDLSPEQLADIEAADRRELYEREKRAEKQRLQDEIDERQERLGRL
jgi:hypothetical protein